jgi:ketosteroid isomerase-like protein
MLTMNDNIIDEVLNHHLTAFGSNNLEEIIKDYNETSVIITPNAILTGLDGIRQFFEEFFAVIPTGSAFSMKQKAIAGNVAYIAWSSDSASTTIPIGTDTFVFDGDKIQYHTVADYRIKK